jgi:hypothetical protein
MGLSGSSHILLSISLAQACLCDQEDNARADSYCEYPKPRHSVSQSLIVKSCRVLMMPGAMILHESAGFSMIRRSQTYALPWTSHR